MGRFSRKFKKVFKRVAPLAALALPGVGAAAWAGIRTVGSVVGNTLLTQVAQQAARSRQAGQEVFEPPPPQPQSFVPLLPPLIAAGRVAAPVLADWALGQVAAARGPDDEDDFDEDEDVEDDFDEEFENELEDDFEEEAA